MFGKGLKTDLFVVDAELASVRNELIKKSEVLAEEVKTKQALQYQVCISLLKRTMKGLFGWFGFLKMEQDFRGAQTSSKDTTQLKNVSTYPSCAPVMVWSEDWSWHVFVGSLDIKAKSNKSRNCSCCCEWHDQEAGKGQFGLGLRWVASVDEGVSV